jgi:hypothetical protein
MIIIIFFLLIYLISIPLFYRQHIKYWGNRDIEPDAAYIMFCPVMNTAFAFSYLFSNIQNKHKW